jgi:nucleoside diphosphate kinase
VERSFVLLKPDCLRTGRSPAVESAAAAEGLVVVCRHPVTLTPEDVRLLWSEYVDGSHVLMLALLDRYLCAGPSEVLLLEGADAFEGARRVKRAVRSRYANGPFANLVHTAERRSELARQANHLLGRCSSCAGPFTATAAAGSARVSARAAAPASASVLAPAVAAGPVSAEPPGTPLRPGGRDFRPDVDVPGLVEAVWPVLQSLDPPAPAPYRLDGRRPAAAVYLGADPAHSLDSAVTAVWSALPGIAVADALLLQLYAGRVGGYPIAVGSRSAVARSHRVLLDHGITACGIGPAPH